MIQLTDGEREALRRRAREHSETVTSLQAQQDRYLAEPVQVPDSGIANWKLYYYCPECSMMLDFDRHRPKDHICPSCGRNWQGEPYDSAWWGMVNGMNHSAARDLSWLYLLTGEKRYAWKTAEILNAYARNYPNYKVHGKIPYNGPGRIGAQTIDEATFMREMACAYDRVEDAMTEEEKTLVRDQLFLPSAEFLREHRKNQLHNHEVIISSAIAVIGMLYGRQDLIDFAVNAPYGIVYQLEQGVLPGGMWFEDCFSYHFYALESFFAYEKFALHTPYSHIRHPNYLRMLEIAWDQLLPDGSIPQIGDCKTDHYHHVYELYEFAYRELGGEKLAAMLREHYRHARRENLEALLYGVEALPGGEDPARDEVYPEIGGSGQTLLRGKKGAYLLLRSDEYGGEHDHYDRLGILYQAGGHTFIPDLGTTGYGARLHYAYYKNTATHNTVNIFGRNQPPQNARLTRWETRGGMTYAEAVCDWNAPFRMPDSFTIPQWDEEAYAGVKMTRRIAWMDRGWLETFRVEGAAAGAEIDWMMHFRAETEPFGEPGILTENADTPYGELRRVTVEPANDRWMDFVHEGRRLYVYSGAFDGQRFLAQGPDNPSNREVTCLIERAKGEDVLFAHAFFPEGKSEALNAKREKDCVRFQWMEAGQMKQVLL